MDCLIRAQASVNDVASLTDSPASSISISTYEPFSVAPQNATAKSSSCSPASALLARRYGSLGSNLSLGTLRFDTPEVSCVSAHKTTPSRVLKPAITVTAFLRGSRLGLECSSVGFGNGLIMRS